MAATGRSHVLGRIPTEIVDPRATATQGAMTASDRPGWRHLPEFLTAGQQQALLAEVRAVIEAAPLYVPTMPRTGRPFSVRMTNCGALGWVSDKAGYRYQATHPVTRRPWPP